MTESLISRPKKDDKNPDLKTEATPDQVVEPNADTSGISDTDTSNQGKDTDWEKRYKDLQSFHSKREADLRKKLDEMEKKDSTFQAPTTPEELEKFKTEHPKVYNMMLTLAHEKAAEATQGISEKIQTFEKDRAVAEQQKLKQKIQEAHADYAEIVASKEFHEWADNQPMQVQNWIYNNPDDADLAIIALDRYKATRDSASTAKHPEKGSTNKSSAASAAQAVSSGKSGPDVSGEPKIWTASEIKKMSSAEFKKNEAEIDKAYAEGRVNFKA